MPRSEGLERAKLLAFQPTLIVTQPGGMRETDYCGARRTALLHAYMKQMLSLAWLGNTTEVPVIPRLPCKQQLSATIRLGHDQIRPRQHPSNGITEDLVRYIDKGIEKSAGWSASACNIWLAGEAGGSSPQLRILDSDFSFRLLARR